MSVTTKTYTTQGKLSVSRDCNTLPYQQGIETLIDQLDTQRGAVFASNFEYPGRYTRWDVGFINPPLACIARKNRFQLLALNQRGKVLLPALKKTLSSLKDLAELQHNGDEITGTIQLSQQRFAEELRSKQPSIFTVIRSIIELFFSNEDDYLGLYGALGYDLAFQFEPIELKIPRDDAQRDMVLYIPDEIVVVDHRKQQAKIYRYDFSYNDATTTGLARDGLQQAFKSAASVAQSCDHQPGEYADIVRIAKESFKKGDLFETVPGQTFFEPCQAPPSEIFRRLRERNPSPYGLFVNLGDNEYLVGASPEMYVRVTGNRLETCPISGTIKRGADAIADAAQIQTLLNSKKDESELTMCTDVDRNDKSRICQPGSVRVIGRRQIEMYSRLIHTVDHVEGLLREGYDALDAFLTHTWVVTVTGAPKTWAMQFIENHEKSPRRWYGGAIGMLNFNGNMNTGLTIRTIRIHHGVAEVRAGATLLYDSDPDAEEKETQLKASAFLDAIRQQHEENKPIAMVTKNSVGNQLHVLLVDHQDSFVHTLANYLRQTGALVTTLRSGLSAKDVKKLNADLMVLSPGPGAPKDFNVAASIDLAQQFKCPIFGVCLGLQAIVEYFGGTLSILDYPMHGKPAEITTMDGKLFSNIPNQFKAARYHSLYADKKTLPDVLQVTAESADGVIMAIEHKTLPIWAVQFHPESILTLHDNVGMRIIHNVVALAAKR